MVLNGGHGIGNLVVLVLDDGLGIGKVLDDGRGNGKNEPGICSVVILNPPTYS